MDEFSKIAPEYERNSAQLPWKEYNYATSYPRKLITEITKRKTKKKEDSTWYFLFGVRIKLNHLKAK